MLRSTTLRNTRRIIGTAALAGALSIGVLAIAPLSAEANTTVVAQRANSVRACANSVKTYQVPANGVRANGGLDLANGV
jgi:hypothetical protein